MRLSVLETLWEAAGLWFQYFWLLLTLSIVTAIPDELATAFARGNNSLYFEIYYAHWIRIALALLGIILIAMKNAAVLGALKTSFAAGKPTTCTGILISVRGYTWALVRVNFLLLGVTILAMLPIGLAVMLLKKTHVQGFAPVAVFVTILYLVLFKYALADPLVVVDNLRARAALKKSWEMTKDRFWYVFGCCVFLAISEYSLTSLLNQFVSASAFSYPGFVVGTTQHLFSSLWVLTAWRMYIKIKAAESNEPAPQPVDLLAPMHPR